MTFQSKKTKGRSLNTNDNFQNFENFLTLLPTLDPSSARGLLFSGRFGPFLVTTPSAKLTFEVELIHVFA